MAYGNATFVAVASDNAAAASPDGITWTATTMPGTQQWWSVTYGSGTFVAVSLSSAGGAISPDGIAWTAITMPFTAGCGAVTYGNGIFLAVENLNDNRAATSP